MERHVVLRSPLVVALLLLLAGCLGGSPDGDEEGVLAPGPVLDLPRFQGPCDNALLFQFVDYSATDPYLPPGFHPSDAKNFLTISPVAFGQAAVLFIVVSCQDALGQNYTAGSLDIFIEPPFVPDLVPARFNFYELERYGDAGPLAETLAAAGWPMPPGSIVVSPTDDALDGADVVGGSVVDNHGELVNMSGVAAAKVDLGLAKIRFWHQGPTGLGYVEYEANLDSVAGPGSCAVRPGTALAAFIASPLLPSLPIACPPGDPVVATFPLLQMNVTAQFLAGVQAG